MDAVRRLVSWVASKLPAPRVIQDGLGRSAYLSRYYLIPSQRPRMPDGSEPFDRWGNPREETSWPDKPWALYLHRFHRSDVDRELHNHPWQWAVSLVLVGGYLEERRVRDEHRDAVEYRCVRPGAINIIRGDDFHRVDLLEHDAWTLFLVGPKVQSWGFWDPASHRVTPWREFLKAKQGALS
jgi:hypothetical protein